MFMLSVVEVGTRSLPPGTDLGLSFVGDFEGDLRRLRLRDLLGLSWRLMERRPYSARSLEAAKLLK